MITASSVDEYNAALSRGYSHMGPKYDRWQGGSVQIGPCAQEVEQLRAENAKMLAAVEGRQAALARGSEQVTRTRVAVDTASRECATSSAAIRSAQIYHSSRLNQQCFPGAKHHAHVCTCMLQEMQWRAQT